jgi:predicted PurR-regulated permease PerM
MVAQTEQQKPVKVEIESSSEFPLTPKGPMEALRTVAMRSGFWWRITLAGAAAIFLGLGVLAAVQALGHPLSVLILALAIASAFAPLVGFLDRRLPRVIAVAIVYLAFPLLLALIAYLTAPSVVGQLEDISASLPDFLTRIQPLLNRLGNLTASNLISNLTSLLTQFTSTLLQVPLTILRSLLDIVSILFISIYALLEAPRALEFVLSLVPLERRERLDDLLHDMVWEMGGYLRGAFLDGVIIGISTYLGLLLIGIDFPLVLGFFAGLMEIVPAIGPIIAAVPILIVALLQSTSKAVLALVFMVGIHQFEGNLVFPNVMRSQTAISPMLVLIALLGGYAVAGVLGAITAIPVVAVSRVVVVRVVAPFIRGQTGAPEPAMKVQKRADSRDREAGTEGRGE